MTNKDTEKKIEDIKKQIEENKNFSLGWLLFSIFIIPLMIDSILFVHPEAWGAHDTEHSVGRFFAGVIVLATSNAIWDILFKSEKIILIINTVLWYVILIGTISSALFSTITGRYYALDAQMEFLSQTELYMEYGLLAICSILLLVTFYYHMDYLQYKRLSGKTIDDWFDDRFEKDDKK